MSQADKLAIRETIEAYLHFLDARQWHRVAACFTLDARSHYNFEPDALLGGASVVDWIRTRLAGYLGTDHALSHLHLEIEGDRALCDSQVTASLLYEAAGKRRIAVRCIHYRDRLRRDGECWRIYERLHEPRWQYEVAADAVLKL